MTRSDLRSLIRTEAQESSTSVFTDTILNNLILNAIDDISSFADLQSAGKIVLHLPFDTVKNYTVTGDGVARTVGSFTVTSFLLPTDFIKDFKVICSSATGQAVEKMDYEDWELALNTDDFGNDPKVIYYTIQDSYIVFDRTLTAGDTYSLRYYKRHATLSDDVITLDSRLTGYERLIVYHVVSNMEAMNENYDKNGFYEKRYLKMLIAFYDWIRHKYGGKRAWKSLGRETFWNGL